MMKAKLVVVGGETKTKEVNLRLPAVVGRGRDATLLLAQPLVSRKHCEIFESQGMLVVRDLGSLNGTFVGNERIDEAPLPPGELLTIGSVTFRAVYDLAPNVSTASGPQAGPTFTPAPSPPLPNMPFPASGTKSKPNSSPASAPPNQGGIPDFAALGGGAKPRRGRPSDEEFEEVELTVDEDDDDLAEFATPLFDGDDDDLPPNSSDEAPRRARHDETTQPAPRASSRPNAAGADDETNDDDDDLQAFLGALK